MSHFLHSSLVSLAVTVLSPRRLPITVPLPSLRSLVTRVTAHSLRSFPSVYDVSEWRVNRESPTDTSGETKGRERYERMKVASRETVGCGVEGTRGSVTHLTSLSPLWLGSTSVRSSRRLHFPSHPFPFPSPPFTVTPLLSFTRFVTSPKKSE